MAIEVKICGINSRPTLAAAIDGGAAYVGLNFYPPSPRFVSIEQAAALSAAIPEGVAKVGLLVDADDALIARILAVVPLDMLQLHGSESPARVSEIRSGFGRPVMKAVKIESAEDVTGAEAYCGAADRLLFDAKPPKGMIGALPGGNAISFDWRLLAGRRWPLPWMLSGGLDAGNVAEAVSVSGTPAVDVSSGVEDRPGVKNPEKISAFLKAARIL
ncbi:MAG: phosphoribosylanthranilate isomerase [Alphaproteobacteria bacterium]